MKNGSRSGSVLAAFLLAAAAAFAADAPPTTPPPGKEKDFKAEVVVRIGEIQLLVTDKDGAAVKDLKPEEIEIREEGKAREIAYLEPFATRDLAVRVLPHAAPLVTTAGQRVAEDEGAVRIPVPKPVRRIVLLFDGFNTRTQDRARNVAAARNWVETKMRPEDSVAVAALARDGVKTLVNFTADKAPLLQLLQDPGFMPHGEFHDFLADIKVLMDSLHTCDNAYDTLSCAQMAAQPVVYDWESRSRQTVAALRSFIGTIAAIPGRKAVLLFSDGLLLDPGAMAGEAILGAFGTDAIDYGTAHRLFESRVQGEVMEMTRVAAAADVTFFTFDTRSSGRRTEGSDVDLQTQMNERRNNDPYTAAFDETRSALDTISYRTGGRGLHGPMIEKSLPAAASAVEGLYTVGFRRDPSIVGAPKIKVKISRKGVEATFPDRFDPLRGLPQALPLEIGVGKPRVAEGGIAVPIIVQAPLDDVSVEKNEGKWDAQVSFYVEAIAVDGRRAAEAYETVEFSLTDEQKEHRVGRKFGHTLLLPLRPGAYRLRARMSEGVFKHAAERAVDITVGTDYSIHPGIQGLGENQTLGSPSKADSTADGSGSTVK